MVHEPNDQAYQHPAQTVEELKQLHARRREPRDVVRICPSHRIRNVFGDAIRNRVIDIGELLRREDRKRSHGRRQVHRVWCCVFMTPCIFFFSRS